MLEKSMRRKLVTLPIAIFIVLYPFIIPFNASAEHSIRNPNIKYMLGCNISIEGRGYSSWLNGFSMNGKTFISMALAYVNGTVCISSIKNPGKKYLFHGEQIVFMIGYAGYYYSNNDYIPYIIYNGTATMALLISMR